jgi:hypothetical protein
MSAFPREVDLRTDSDPSCCRLKDKTGPAVNLCSIPWRVNWIRRSTKKRSDCDKQAVKTFKDGNDLAAGRAQQGLGSSERKAELVVPGIAN